MTVSSTYATGYLDPRALTQLPSLREREYDGICNAIADGQMIAIAREVRGFGEPPCSEIVGVLSPDAAAEYLQLVEDVPAREKQATAMGEQLRELRSELVTLREIVREVMNEKVPVDFDDRIYACVSDAEAILTGATEMAEEL